MKVGLKDGNKPEGWTRNEHKEIEKFNDLTVDSFEVEVEFEECMSDSQQLEDEMQGLYAKSDVSEERKKEETLEVEESEEDGGRCARRIANNQQKICICSQDTEKDQRDARGEWKDEKRCAKDTNQLEESKKECSKFKCELESKPETC